MEGTMIPDDMRSEFIRDINRAKVCGNPKRRTETILRVYTIAICERTGSALGGAADAEIRAELEQIVREAT